jgi:hypothetical protein
MFSDKAFEIRIVRLAMFALCSLLVLVFVAGAHTMPSRIQLSFGAGGGIDPVIAVASKDDVDVAWIGSSVFFERSTDGGHSFSSPKEVQALSGTAGDLQIGLDRYDHINLLWTVGGNVFFSRSTDRGETFSTPENLTVAEGVLPGSVKMVVEPDGAVDLFWVKQQRFAALIGQFSRSTDGEMFSSPVTIATMNAQIFSLGGDVQGAVGPAGQVYVLMTLREQLSNSDPCSVIFVRSVNHGEVFSSPLGLSGPVMGNAPCVAAQEIVDRRGSIDVALTFSASGPLAPTPPQNVSFIRSTDDGASFSTPVNVSATPQSPSVESVHLAVGSPRDIFIVWSGDAAYFSHSRDLGKTFTEPKVLSGFASNPVLAANQHGNLDVAWADSVFDQSGIPPTTDILLGRSDNEGADFQNPVDLSRMPNQSEISPELVLNRHGDAFLVWQANEESLPSQVFFSRVSDSFPQPVDFRIKVSPKTATTLLGGVLQFEVVGSDVDDAKGLDLICAPQPSTSPNQSAEVAFTTCTFNPSTLSVHGARKSQLTVTVPPGFLTGEFFLGVSAVGSSTVNTQTVEFRVGEQ